MEYKKSSNGKLYISNNKKIIDVLTEKEYFEKKKKENMMRKAKIVSILLALAYVMSILIYYLYI